MRDLTPYENCPSSSRSQTGAPREDVGPGDETRAYTEPNALGRCKKGERVSTQKVESPQRRIQSSRVSSSLSWRRRELQIRHPLIE